MIKATKTQKAEITKNKLKQILTKTDLIKPKTSFKRSTLSGKRLIVRMAFYIKQSDSYKKQANIIVKICTLQINNYAAHII